MSLASPALTATSTKKRKQTLTKAQEAELERGWRERNIRLKEMGLPKETLDQYKDWVYGRGKKTQTQSRSSISQKTATKAVYGKTTISGREISAKTKEETKIVNGAELGCGTEKSRHWVKGACTVKQTPTYTGSKIIGIGTMHKSNLVPIFSDEEAKDISRMRR